MYYRGIGPEVGRIINGDEAYEYAKSHLDMMPEEDKQLFVSFYFSGNWVREHGMKVRKQRIYEAEEGLRSELV